MLFRVLLVFVDYFHQLSLLICKLLDIIPVSCAVLHIYDYLVVYVSFEVFYIFPKKSFTISSLLILCSWLSRFREPHVHGAIGYGCVTSLDHIKIEADTVAVTDGIALHDLPGAAPFCGCIRSQSLRTGPMAFGGVGLPQMIVAVDKLLLVAWTPIEKFSENGIVLGGSPIEKFFETAEGQQIWKNHTDYITLKPGECIYIPFGYWIRVLYYDPPVKGIAQTCY